MDARTARQRRSSREIERDIGTRRVVVSLGRAVRAARRRRALTQRRLGERVGLSQSQVSRIELGQGGAVPIGTWLALAGELGLTPRFELQRDWREEPVDAGHLAIQQMLLRLGREHGYDRQFELRTRTADPSRSIDVNWRSDRHHRLVVIEAWNTIGDVGAGVRSFQRKLADAAELAIAIGGDGPHGVHGVWVVRATKRNRDLVARYPDVFRAALPGPSARWVAALMTGAAPPAEPGLVWCDVRATRLFAWRAAQR